MTYKFSLIVLVLLLIAGCATPNRISSVQIGMTEDEVIKLIGRPLSKSAKSDTEYLNYQRAEWGPQGLVAKPYYVRLIRGKVDSFGRLGDFDSTQKPTVRVESDETINANVTGKTDLYSELKKLKELKDEGIISESEFEKEKKELLEKY
jgi:hypothetical protein